MPALTLSTAIAALRGTYSDRLQIVARRISRRGTARTLAVERSGLSRIMGIALKAFTYLGGGGPEFNKIKGKTIR